MTANTALLPPDAELWLGGDEFPLVSGGSLSSLRVAYEISGPAGAPVIAVLGGISADRHPFATAANPSAGWWDGLGGPGRAIDTDPFCVLAFDYLGGAGLSSSAAHFGPAAIAPADQAEVLVRLLDNLGIAQLAAIVGCSYGGMVALELAARHPARVRTAVVIAAAHESHPLATAWRSIQRRVVRLGVERGAAHEAIAIARGLGIATYRSRAEFAARFAGEPTWRDGRACFPVDGYLDAQGARFAKHFDPAAFLCLSESIDLHRVRPETIRVPTTVIAFDSDQLVPVAQARELAARIAGPSRLVVIPTVYGHDGFLKETERLAPELSKAIASPPVALPVPVPVPVPVPDAPARNPRTIAVRAGVGADREYGAVMPPIHLSSTFEFEGLARPRRYDYTRSGNPTRDQLVETLAALEGAHGGVVTSSGMSAIVVALKLVEAGGIVVAPHDGYGGTYRLLRALEKRSEIRLRLVNQTDPAALDAALEGGAALVWIETPSNPLLRITDLAHVISRAKRAGAIAVVDNTFLSPALQSPLAFGADVVVHSTTKYLNGHSDVVGGAALAASEEVARQLKWWANCLGVTGAPFDSYLSLRGVRTLHLRMAAHEENARRVSALLVDDPRVARVYYPGLTSHPGHALACRQQRGFGAMLSFELAHAPGTGPRDVVEAFLDGLECLSLAESLGGVESLICHPATMTHAAMDAEARATAGISDALLRLSIGIEAPDDLCRDLSRALDRVGSLSSAQKHRAGELPPRPGASADSQ